MDITLHEFPGRQLRFILPAADSLPTQLQLAHSATDAIACMNGDTVSNLTADLTLCYCDSEFAFPVNDPQPARPFWFLAAQHRSPQITITPAWVNAVETNRPQIDTSVLNDWIGQALAESAGEDTNQDDSLIIAWQELLIRANRIRLPTLDIKGDAIPVLHGSNPIHYPIERIDNALYVSGPLEAASVTAPIDMRLTNEAGFLTLHISLYWSLWTDPQQAGWSDINAAVASLLANGWILDYSDLPEFSAGTG